MTELALFETLVLVCRVDTYGTVHYYNALGQHHRVHGPAIEYPDGQREWYQNGLLHRLDGPAIEHPCGFRAWYQTGQLHRTDGPAVIYSDGVRDWFQNGHRHRAAAPADERINWARACISTVKSWLSLKFGK
jgi:hypothetical protein